MALFAATPSHKDQVPAGSELPSPAAELAGCIVSGKSPATIERSSARGIVLGLMLGIAAWCMIGGVAVLFWL